ncbi:MAG: TIR domain-containing protein [Sedimenticolaceae bacterium]
MSAIFLSYRRDDSSGYAGRLFDNLAESFGRERVFMDIETIEPGMDFVAGIDRAIESCGAVIAMIGPNWINAQDANGRRRLDNPRDFIRLEITSALTRGVRVIPVLVHNASMPPEQELPEPLRPLCRLQACEISDNRWEFDVRRLTDVIDPLIAEPEQSPTAAAAAAKAAAEATSTTKAPGRKPGGGPTAWLVAVAALILAAVGGTWWFSQSAPTEPAALPVDEAVPSKPPAAIPSEPIVTTVPSPELPAARPGSEASLAEPPPRSEPLPEVSPEPRMATESTGPEPPPPDEPPLEASYGPELTPKAERVAVPAPRGPSPDELRQREIAELIQAAEIDLAELRLTRPADNNAFDRFQRVLELDPDNPRAREGLVAITARYHGLIEDALDRNALDNAQRYLDSARAVDPSTAWLNPLQREIDQRRHVTALPERKPERSAQPDVAKREACLSACEHSHQACRAEIDPQIEASCLRSREEACERLYESCISDSSKMFLGEVSHESQCIGVHANCRRTSAKDCGAARQIAEERCDTEFGTCTEHCQSLE